MPDDISYLFNEVDKRLDELETKNSEIKNKADEILKGLMSTPDYSDLIKQLRDPRARWNVNDDEYSSIPVKESHVNISSKELKTICELAKANIEVIDSRFLEKVIEHNLALLNQMFSDYKKSGIPWYKKIFGYFSQFEKVLEIYSEPIENPDLHRIAVKIANANWNSVPCSYKEQSFKYGARVLHNSTLLLIKKIQNIVNSKFAPDTISLSINDFNTIITVLPQNEVETYRS